MNNNFQGLKNLSFGQMMHLIQSSRAEKKPFKSKLLGYLLLGLGILVCLTITVGLLYYFIDNGIRGGAGIMKVISLVVYLFPIYAFILPGSKLIKAAGEPMVRSNNYVLYLRSFRTDEEIDHWKYGLISSPESVIGNVFDVFGPLVGLGARGNEASFGGYRIFVDNDNWRQIVFSLVHHAALTVLYFSDRPQVVWELSLCRKYADPKRFVIYIDEELDKNIDLLNSYGIFNGYIEKKAEKVCFIAFDEQWWPVDPFLDRLKGKPLKIGIRRFALRRMYHLDEGPNRNDVAFKWIRRAFAWQFVPILVAMLVPLMSVFNPWDFVWLFVPVTVVSIAYVLGYYHWSLKSLKLLEYISFTRSFAEEKRKLKMEVNFIVAGLFIEVLPLTIGVLILLFTLINSVGLRFLLDETNYILDHMAEFAGIWVSLVLVYFIVAIVFFIYRIRRKGKRIVQVETFFKTRARGLYK